MQAVIQDRYGPPSALRVGEISRPVPGPGEVLVRVHAASLHADVWHMVRGVPYVLRLMGAGVRRPKNPVPGTDLAGVVEELGQGVARFAPGDPVFGEVVVGTQWHNAGAFAEYAAVPEAKLERKPAGLSFVEAAAVPTSALIALLNVGRESRLAPGSRVLVNGAAGGVGMFVVQIAKGRGAHVTGVDSGARLDVVRRAGADEVIDFTQADFTQGPQRYDLVVDIPGNHSFARVRRVLREGGRYVLIGHDQYGAEGRRWLGSIPRFIGLMLRSAVTPELPRPDFSASAPDSLRVLAEMIDAGRLRPYIDRTFPLAETPAAVAYLESGRACGKIVITMTD